MHKIVLLDSDEIVQMLCEEELSAEGYWVIPAKGVEELFSLIREEDPDAIVMEAVLEGCNCLNILQMLRARYYDLPVILHSKYPNLQYDPRVIAADSVVVKASGFRELKDQIRMSLESTRSIASAARCSELRGQPVASSLSGHDIRKIDRGSAAPPAE